MSSAAPAEGFVMPVLDKPSFNRTIELVALRVPAKLVGDSMKLLRSHLLNKPKMKDVAATESDTSRLILLSEDADASALPSVVADFVAAHELTVLPHTVTLGYEMLTADQVLKRLLPEGMDVPSSFEQIGHIAHLNLRDEHGPYKPLIAEVLLDKNQKLRTVVNKTDSIDTVFRTFKMEVLAGDPSLETEVHESGCRFQLNFEQVYWNSRLQAEHRRMVDMLSTKDVVCDVFAGIGPFAVPAAKKGCLVYANDLNPASHKYMLQNMKLNKVEKKLKPFNLDGRKFVQQMASDGVLFTQVFMNLPASAAEFLDVFSEAFADYPHAMPMVHCYCFSKADDPCADAVKQCEQALGQPITESLTVEDVRDVAPKKRMLCVSFKMPKSKSERPAKKAKVNDSK